MGGSSRQQEYHWVGENESLDHFAYNEVEEAYKGKLYNLGWAGRFGGISIQGNELKLPATSTQNRFLKMMVQVDEVGRENAFDNLSVYYWLEDDPKDPDHARSIGLPKNSLSDIKGSKGYITITLDLGWTNEEEMTVDSFRLDMFSSSLQKASNSTDGAHCGDIYVKYIGFFDTQEAADNYEMVIPTNAPETPTPEPKETEKPTPTATQEPGNISNNNGSQVGVSYIGILIIGVGGIVALAVIAIILIIVIPNRRRNK